MKPRRPARLHAFLYFHLLARRDILSVFGYAPDYDTPAGCSGDAAQGFGHAGRRGVRPPFGLGFEGFQFFFLAPGDIDDLLQLRDLCGCRCCLFIFLPFLPDGEPTVF